MVWNTFVRHTRDSWTFMVTRHRMKICQKLLQMKWIAFITVVQEALRKMPCLKFLYTSALCTFLNFPSKKVHHLYKNVPDGNLLTTVIRLANSAFVLKFVEIWPSKRWIQIFSSTHKLKKPLYWSVRCRNFNLNMSSPIYMLICHGAPHLPIERYEPS